MLTANRYGSLFQWSLSNDQVRFIAILGEGTTNLPREINPRKNYPFFQIWFYFFMYPKRPLGVQTLIVNLFIISQTWLLFWKDIMSNYLNFMEKLSSIKLANMDLIYWSVRSSNRRGGDYVKIVDGEYHSFSQLRASLYHKYMKILCNIQLITYRLLYVSVKLPW